MKRKKCRDCNKTRLVKFFHKNKASKDGYSLRCKCCLKIIYQNTKKEYSRLLYQRDRERILKRNKRWNKENLDKTRKHKKKFFSNNPNYHTEYREQHKDRLNHQCRIRCAEYRKNPLFKLKANCRSRLYDYYRGTNRSKRSEEIIGLSWPKLKIYIEKQFQPGMTWDNYGEWHIDHIIPLSLAKNKKELEKLFYYTNCQPL